MTSCVDLAEVSKTFGATRALTGLTFAAPTGAITAILGPNGAGKTTALEICAGLQHPGTGTVRILGLDPRSDAATLRPRVGVMIQDGGLPVMSRAGELLRHVARFYREPREVDELIETLGLAPFARTSVRRLSGGQRQRLALAIALVGSPELVFLDEPSAGLDPQARLAVWDLVRGLRAQGVSVLLSTHLMDEAAQLADHVVIIDHGAVIAQGSVDELTAAPEAGPRSPGSLELSGAVSDQARVAVSDVARRYGLELAETDPSRSHRTLEDVFLELTGRSLR